MPGQGTCLGLVIELGSGQLLVLEHVLELELELELVREHEL